MTQPDATEFWFLPLGGTGEIGMNMNLYGHDDCWLLVDCGTTFAGPDEPGPRVQMADPGAMQAAGIKPAALLLTHAHEDHLGAVAALWPQLRCPVHGTPFALEVLRRKLTEHGLAEEVPCIQVRPGSRMAVGPFMVDWVGMTHSVPEACALVLQTSAGTVLHTGDWKLDPQPVVGRISDVPALQRLAAVRPLAVVCDSTNAMESGWSVSEGALRAGLEQVTGSTSGRVVVTTFGSNIARLETLARVALATGRRMGVLGRSLQNMVAAALATGVWQPPRPLLDPFDLGYLPRDEVLLVVTGSQGDAGAALDRLSRGNHPLLELEPGDRVVFSSRVIPGNEAAVETIRRALVAAGIDCLDATDALIHASGHPCRDELWQLYDWVQPDMVIPVHGTPAHLAAQAELARQWGVPGVLEGYNGDLFELAPEARVRPGWLGARRLGLGRSGLQAVASPDYRRHPC